MQKRKRYTPVSSSTSTPSAVCSAGGDADAPVDCSASPSWSWSSSSFQKAAWARRRALPISRVSWSNCLLVGSSHSRSCASSALNLCNPSSSVASAGAVEGAPPWSPVLKRLS
eukprot:scaffold533_cov369-Prasinococcus_capsulatus_cf.AAC.4